MACAIHGVQKRERRSRAGSGIRERRQPPRLQVAHTKRRFLETIPNAWKQWVAHSKLLNTNDDTIVEILINNGYNRAAALAEVRQAASDPYLLGAARTRRRLPKLHHF